MMCKFPTRCRVQICFIVAAVFAALAGTLTDQHAAYAQGGDNDYVDVGLTLEVPPHKSQGTSHVLSIVVVNQGARTAYDVEVVVSIESPALSHFDDEPANVLSQSGGVAVLPIGSLSLESNDRSLRWSIPALKGGQRVEYLVGVTFETATAPTFDNSRSPHEFLGRVTTSSFEGDLHKGNNTSRVWSYRYSASGRYWHAAGNYSVGVSVDNPLPSPGDTVNFTVTTDRAEQDKARGGAPPIDLKVAIDLTGGLSVTGTPTYASVGKGGAKPVPDSVSYSNGVFTVGTLEGPSLTLDGDPIKNSVTLPITVSSSAIVNEQCLTATLTGNPPPGTGPYDDKISDNVAKVCLGVPSHTRKVHQSGTVGVWTIHACQSDVPTNGCDAVNEVDVQLVASTDDSEIIDLTPAVIHVKDVFGRVFDSHTQSVTDGNTVSWQTASPEDPDFTGTRNGVQIALDRRPINDYITNWTNYSLTYVASDLNGADPPGKLAIRNVFNGNRLWTSTTSAPWTFTRTNPFGLSSQSTTVQPFMFEFEKLGTYVFDVTVDLTHASLKDDENNARVFSRTSKTYFHVGPLADLSVADGGASPHAPADRNALTIVAVNNGQDPFRGARVTGLPKGAQVFHASHGSYNGSTGVWEIDRLRVRGYYRSAGVSEPTLVLSASPGETATAKVVYDPYLVCIGSDGSTLSHTNRTSCEAVTGAGWHEGTVYDYNDGDNSAVIRAARGMGGVGAGAPGNPRTQTGTTAVMWDAVEELYGVPVVRYEVQWLGSDWRLLDRVTSNQYADVAPSGRRDYRVRAVNAAGAKGPWSRSTVHVQAGNAGPPLNLRTQSDGNNAIDIFWEAPEPEDAGGSAITGYAVQWSSDGTDGSWRNAGSTTELTFKQRGLKVGEVRYYRVAARNRSGLGLWSDPVMGQTVSGAPDAPTLQAKTLSDYEIELTWNEPKDNGETITGYEIEMSADGSAGSWQGLSAPGADAKSYTDSTLPANTKRFYRIRAVNSVGNGAWSRTVSAITQLTPPDAPSIKSVEADGPNAIVVTWEEPLFIGDLPITQYQVQYAKDQYSEIWRGPQTLSGSARSWRHTGLQPEETWYYQVRASNGGGRWSVWSYISAATTASQAAPTASPGGLRATYDAASRSVMLAWSRPSGQAITGYDLQHSEDNSQWQDLATVQGADALTYTDDSYNVYPGANVYYRIRTTTDDGAGPWSRSVRVSVPADPPDPPRYYTAGADGSNHIYMQWDAPYYDGGSPITGYRVLWCRALDGADEDRCREADPENQSNPLANPPGYSAISLGASARSYTHSVSPGYYYYYLLRATNGGNRWSEWQSRDIFYARTYAGVPAAPGLTARAVDANQIRVTWTRPNSYGSEISEYWLYIYQNGEELYDFDNILEVVRVPGDRTEWIVGDLSPGTTRYFRILALNDNGEGKFSALRQATTHSTSGTQEIGDGRAGRSVRPEPADANGYAGSLRHRRLRYRARKGRTARPGRASRRRNRRRRLRRNQRHLRRQQRRQSRHLRLHQSRRRNQRHRQRRNQRHRQRRRVRRSRRRQLRRNQRLRVRRSQRLRVRLSQRPRRRLRLHRSQQRRQRGRSAAKPV